MAVEKLSIALPSEMVADLKAAVEEGTYASTSEVVRDALRDWKLKRSPKHWTAEELRQLLDPALAELDRGDGIPADVVFKRLRKRFKAAPTKRKS